MHYADCGCRPGTPENGWQEIRSEKCLQVEMNEWARFMAYVTENNWRLE